MNTNINKLIRILIPYTFVVLFAYILSTVAYVYLPKSGVNYIEKSSTNLEYRQYNGFYSQVRVVKKEPVKKRKKQNIQTLSNYVLKGIYSTTSNGGWIIVENKRTKQSSFISQDETLDGYLLVKLYKKYVVFEKNSKEYKLDMQQKNENIKYEVTRKVDNTNENILVDNDTVKVKRDYLNSYVKDIDKVWNNIAINEIRQNGKIDGFKVENVNKNSVFGKLGLKKGDIIKSINNNVLGSYADAFKVYNNINNTKYLSIEILRDNEIMELNYEID